MRSDLSGHFDPDGITIDILRYLMGQGVGCLHHQHFNAGSTVEFTYSSAYYPRNGHPHGCVFGEYFFNRLLLHRFLSNILSLNRRFLPAAAALDQVK